MIKVLPGAISQQYVKPRGSPLSDDALRERDLDDPGPAQEDDPRLRPDGTAGEVLAFPLPEPATARAERGDRGAFSDIAHRDHLRLLRDLLCGLHEAGDPVDVRPPVRPTLSTLQMAVIFSR